jgi:hypothetical protein
LPSCDALLVSFGVEQKDARRVDLDVKAVSAAMSAEAARVDAKLLGPDPDEHVRLGAQRLDRDDLAGLATVADEDVLGAHADLNIRRQVPAGAGEPERTGQDGPLLDAGGQEVHARRA